MTNLEVIATTKTNNVIVKHTKKPESSAPISDRFPINIKYNGIPITIMPDRKRPNKFILLIDQLSVEVVKA